MGEQTAVALKFTVNQLANLNMLRGIHLMGGEAVLWDGQPSAEMLELEQMGMVKFINPPFCVGITEQGLSVIEGLRRDFHFDDAEVEEDFEDDDTEE